ncbi:MAG: methyltransferase domain-containing protein [Pseudomonadota bacterium]
MDLKEEELLGGAISDHWYYASKARAMLASLPRAEGLRVLDVGAGSGFFSRWLLQQGAADSAICVDPGYERDHEEIVNGRPLRFRRDVGKTDANLVLMMDVLEHVDDDTGLVSEYLAKAAPDADLFITVPAFQFLWSHHDEFLEHRRRYTISTARQMIERAGARAHGLHYYFGAVFPLAAMVRLLGRLRQHQGSDMRPQHPVVNAILKAACAVERIVMRANRLAGLSVICLCRRKDLAAG